MPGSVDNDDVGRVEFAGALSREKIAEHYRHAAVLCLPSIYEGFPVTILEAMAAGLPVVATRVGGTPELVHDGCGILVPPRDPVALANALSHLARHRTLGHDLGRAGRERVETYFTLDRMIATYRDLYHELAGIVLIEEFVPWLIEARLDGRSSLDAYASLASQIAGAADTFKGFIWDDGGREFLKDTAGLMQTWIGCVRRWQ